MLSNRKNRILLLFVLIIMFSLVACGNRGLTDKLEVLPNEEDTVAVEEEKTEENTAESSEDNIATEAIDDLEEFNNSETLTVSNDNLKEYISFLDGELDKHYGGHKIEQSEDVLYVYVWMDGVATEAAGLVTGVSNNWDDWENVKSNMEDAAKAVREGLEIRGIENMHVSYNLVNDINQDNILLSILDDTSVIDSVRDEYNNRQNQ